MNALRTPTRSPSLALRVHRGASEFTVSRVLGAGETIRQHLFGSSESVTCVARDVAYGDHARQRLDVYAPAAKAPIGTLVYVHGGGFRLLSRTAHASIARRFAECGWLVFAADYRRAPEFRYPFAALDASLASRFARSAGVEYGAPARGPLVFAGESAGAHIALSIALASAMPFDEPWARRVFEWGWQPDALILGSGLFQLSNPARHDDGSIVGRASRLELENVARAYLGDPPRQAALADLLDVLETRTVARPLPALMAFAGTDDPLLTETRELVQRFRKQSAPCLLHIEEGSGHSYHAFQWTAAARRTWSKINRFGHDLREEHLGYSGAREALSENG